MLRWIWNTALAEQQARHKRGEKYASYVDMAKWLTAWRHAPATSWLAIGPMHPQQQVLRRLDEAYRRFFAKAGGFPKFKPRGRAPGIRFPDPKQFVLDAANGRLKLPKLGWVRLRQSQSVDGVLRNVSLRQEGCRWFASLQVEINAPAGTLGVPPTLGVDLGLAAFAATSTGTLVPPLQALAKQQRRLKHAQRAVARKKKGSCNRRKAVYRLGNLHRRIARQRLDWINKLTTDLADSHPVVAIEDLKIKNMSSSAKGTAEAPGRNVKAKAGLNRGILDAAWGEFTRQLGYKLEWRGGELLLVNPAYTSRTCRICAHESAQNRKTQAVFCCVACGHAENADIHAAKNILAAGRAVWQARRAAASDACGGDVRQRGQITANAATPVKQEPTEVTMREMVHV
jgi:putative transposase